MKKVYSKPEIVFESFVMNTSIAACGKDTNLPTKNVCGIPFGEDTLFSVGIIEQCTAPGDDNLYCYHVPTDSTILFGS